MLGVILYACFVSDIHECVSNPCQNQGTCHDGVNTYSCTCTEGYTGTACDKGIIV